MKLKNLMVATFLSSLIFMNIAEAKKPPEYYSFKIRELEDRGDYLEVVELLNRMIDEYDGEVQAINGKGCLLNLYQGKCGPLAFGRGFPLPRPSDENRARCAAMQNLPKAVVLFEELVSDLEDFVEDRNIPKEGRVWAYGRLVYIAGYLENIYSEAELAERIPV